MECIRNFCDIDYILEEFYKIKFQNSYQNCVLGVAYGFTYFILFYFFNNAFVLRIYLFTCNDQTTSELQKKKNPKINKFNLNFLKSFDNTKH